METKKQTDGRGLRDTEIIMREALQHIADGSENVCTACGWIGNEVRFDHGGEDSDAACPNCGSLDVEQGADEIATYALRQVETGATK